MSCRVKVEQGELEGRVCTSHFGQTYYSFEGIPYARPPVGKLRFRAPQEPDGWSGIRDAKKPGNKCSQINPYGRQTLEGSEDCLYLNVYTPKLPKKDLNKLPVLFFVHGGRLIVGYGDYYRPDLLIKHDVILVTINYRLHILGFLCLHTPEVPGNAGMKDTVMALKWVKRNIQYFNGDHDNITVFGESAGAAIVTSYLTSKTADGLFDKVISQSGNPLSDLFMVEDDDEGKGRHIAELMGENITDTKNLCDFLTDAPIEDLINAFVIAELSRPPHIINTFFLPVVEKEFEGVERFFEENPHASFRHNRFKKVPIIVTSCSYEGALFLRVDENGDILYEDDFRNFIPRYLSIDAESSRAKNFARELRKFYFKDETRHLSREDKSDYLAMVSDAYFGRDAVLFIEVLSRYMDTYACMFSFNGAMNTSTMGKLGIDGASHGDLMQYVFFRENKMAKCKDKERFVVDTLTEAWCNFAKTSKPICKNLQQEWVPYTADGKHCLHVGEDIEIIRYPNYERYDFWFRFMKEKSKL